MWVVERESLRCLSDGKGVGVSMRVMERELSDAVYTHSVCGV
jgi:hypothetical protein